MAAVCTIADGPVQLLTPPGRLLANPPKRPYYPRMQARHMLAAGLLVLLGLTTSIVAQERYTLTEDDQWSAEDPPPPGSPEAQLAQVRRTLAEKKFDLAYDRATAWIERYPRHAGQPVARLIRGDALQGSKKFYDALFEYEYVLRVYPGSDVFVTALQRELEIAKKFARGMKRKHLGMRIWNADDEAEELLIRIQERLPGSTLAEEAGLELADYYFRIQEMDQAAEAYALFVENYPDSDSISTARRRLIYAHLASFKGPRFDAAGLYEARALLQRLEVVDPVAARRIGSTALQVRIDESDAAKMLETARWYGRTNDFVAAEMMIRRLVARYPHAVATREGVRMAVEILDQLPPVVLREAPDYRALQAGMASRDAQPDSSATADASEDAS